MFTDIEGSTQLVQILGDRFTGTLEAHDRIARESVTLHSGVVIRTAGDSVFAVFASPVDAVGAAIDLQRGIGAYNWPEGSEVRVRIGLHTGAGNLGGNDYVGLDVHRAARISDAGHGGQIVVSEPTALLVERLLGPDISLRDLGKHHLKDLSEPEALFQVAATGIGTDFPPLRTLDLVPNNLPVQVTSFIGRQGLLDDAARLLERARVLTLTGPGGTGKTRLSLQLAANAATGFTDGVYFIDLSSILDSGVVPSAILSAVGLRASGSDQTPYQQLVERIGGKRLLLVLDNFEQVLPAAQLVADMARSAPESKFLVTSRAPLRISGEQEMPIPPLHIETDATGTSEAVQLFVERAMAVNPGFSLDEKNVDDVVALVDRLDGLPLAIELVASRVKLLPVAAILERLDATMLGAGSIDLPERQRTITGAIEWSYQLLDDDQRTLFEKLSVFAGGARLEEIERVCGGAPAGSQLLDRLSELVDHSLVRVDTGDGAPRFRMLFVIQEYALDRLNEHQDADVTRKAHLETYTDFVEGLRPQFLKMDRRTAFDAIEHEHDNIRSALDWGNNREMDLVLRLAAATWRYWQTRGHLYEAQQRIENALEQAGGQADNRALATEALGGVLWWRGDLDGAAIAYTNSLEAARSTGEPRELANALYNLALVRGWKGDSEAAPMLDEAQAIYEQLDDTNGMGDIAWGRGNLLAFSKRFAEASEYFASSTDYYRRSGNEFGMGWSMFEAGGVALKLGESAAGWPYARDGLELFSRHNDVSAVVLLLSLTAGMAIDLGDPIRAHRLAGAFHGLRITSGTDLATVDYNLILGLEFETLESLPDGELKDAYREGKAMTYQDAIDYALRGPTDSAI